MRAEDYVRKMAGIRLLVVGDVMLDIDEHATVRESQEQFNPVYTVRARTFYPGGAANVARIATALGAEVHLVGVVGDDSEGMTLSDELDDRYLVDCVDIVIDPSRPTTTKTRVYADGAPRMRRDLESAAALGRRAAIRVEERISPADVVLFSDYNKGVLRVPGVIEAAMAAAPLRVLDPKIHWAPFAGVQFATPNTIEMPQQALAGILREQLPGVSIVRTLGSEGAMLYQRLHDDQYQATYVRTVGAREVDAVGAGDAFAAAFTLAKAAGAPNLQAIIVGQGVARWWVLHERSDVLSISQIEDQIGMVEDQNSD